jgi:4-carboxymuconolactone decarboxylase
VVVRGPRISPPAPLDAEQRAELAKAPHTADGRPFNVFAALAHRPRLLRRVNALGGYFPRRDGLGGRRRELAILRTAAFVGSAYETAHHRVSAARLSLTPAEIDAVLAPASGHDWAAGDAAVLTAVDELLARHTVSEEAWSALDGVLADPERLELIVLVGFYVMIGGLVNTVGVTPDDVD